MDFYTCGSIYGCKEKYFFKLGLTQFEVDCRIKERKKEDGFIKNYDRLIIGAGAKKAWDLCNCPRMLIAHVNRLHMSKLKISHALNECLDLACEGIKGVEKDFISKLRRANLNYAKGLISDEEVFSIYLSAHGYDGSFNYEALFWACFSIADFLIKDRSPLVALSLIKHRIPGQRPYLSPHNDYRDADAELCWIIKRCISVKNGYYFGVKNLKRFSLKSKILQ